MAGELTLDELECRGRAILKCAYGREDCWTADGGYSAPADWLRTLLESLHAELRGPDDLPAAACFAYTDEVDVSPQARTALDQTHAADVLRRFCAHLAALSGVGPADVKALFANLRAECKADLGLRGREVMFIVRSALTGQEAGPCLEVAVCLLGRRRCLERVQRCLEDTWEESHDSANI